MALKRSCIYVLFQSAITNDSDLKSVRRWMESYSNNENEQSEQEEIFIKNRRTTGCWGRKSTSACFNEDTPAEWNDDISILRTRIEFGQQITHVSHAPRLQHRGSQLSILAAP